MFALIFVILINVLRDLHNQLRKSRELKPKPLCTNCFYAHMQYGSKAERVISCTFGGSIRPVSFEVLYCTTIRNGTQYRGVVQSDLCVRSASAQCQ